MGIAIAGGCDAPHLPNDSSIVITNVTKGSVAEGKLRYFSKYSVWLKCNFLKMFDDILRSPIANVFSYQPLTPLMYVHWIPINLTLSYTGGILQRLGTDVHSAVTAKTSTTL